jgi:hypothetical protein
MPIASSNTSYTLVFEPDLDPDGLGVIGRSLNPTTSDLTITYHFVDFTSTGTILELDPLSGLFTSISARVSVSSFTISYANTSRTTAAGTVVPATSSTSLGVTLLLDPPRSSTGTYVQTGTSVVITALSSVTLVGSSMMITAVTSHGLITGDSVYLDFGTSNTSRSTIVRPEGAVTSARYLVTVNDIKTFTINTSSELTSVSTTTSSSSTVLSVSGLVTIYAGSSSIALTVSGSTTLGLLSFYGQHGPLALDWPVFSEYRWNTRDSKEGTERDPLTQEVTSTLTTVSRSVTGLPEDYFAGYKAEPDMRRTTSITWTATVSLFSSVTNRTTSVTFSGIAQTVLNDWDRFKNQIRNPFVLGGANEANGNTTYAEPVLKPLPAATFTIANTSTVGSGAVITARFSTSHGLSAGTIIFATITSVGVNHSKAQGQFYADTVPTGSSLTYTVTSVGTISTLTSLLGRMSYISYERPGDNNGSSSTTR